MTGLLTPDGRRHILRMRRAVAPSAHRLDRRFRSWLRGQGYDPEQERALMAVTPAAVARAHTLAGFLEQAEYQGRRLAKLNVAPAAINEALRHFDSLLGPVIRGRFAPAREQLQLATRLVIENAFYQVREAEAQAFFGLYRAETEASDLNDMLRRFVGVLTRAFHAARGSLLLQQTRSPELSLPRYIERGQPEERLIGDARLRGRYASYWSFPFGSTAVVQLAFRVAYRWLPREQILLSAAGARCREAIERARMADEIRKLSARSWHAQEEERQRIGRDLHDEAGQAIAFLRLRLEILEREAPPALRPRLAEARDLAGRTAVEIRRIIAALNPAVLDRLGLEAAIRQLAARFRRTENCRLRLSCGIAGQLPKRAEEVAYRVAQECLQNIAKHARATAVNLSLRASDKHIRLRVTDNGGGFCVDEAWRKPKSFGLVGMRERAALLGGTLTVRSGLRKGTTVILELPVNAAPMRFHGEDSRSID